MSASERLAALEDDRKRWIEGDLIPMSAGMKLMKILPELVELAKAAEDLPEGGDPSEPLGAALIAIEEAPE